MKKFLLTTTKVIIIINLFFGLSLILASSTQAQSGQAGCCEVKGPTPYVNDNMDSNECNGKKGDYEYFFHPNQIAKDGKCVDQTTATTNNLPNLKLNAPDIKVSIPGAEKLQPVTCTETSCSIPWLAEYIASLQKYAIGIIGILAAITIMIGGIVWLTAAGNSNQVSSAKTWITGGLSGLVLVLGSYLLLSIINPKLTVLNNLDLTRIGKIDLDPLIIVTAENLDEALKNPNIKYDKYCGCFDTKTLAATTKLTTAEAINNAIKETNPKSPLIGYGATWLAAAQKYGVDPTQLIAQAFLENGLGNSSLARPPQRNINSMSSGWTCPDKAYGRGTSGKKRNWKAYDSYEDAIWDYFCYVAKSGAVKDVKSLKQQQTIYGPPCCNTVTRLCESDTSKYIGAYTSILAKYNNKSFESDKPNGNNCDCYDQVEHCKKAHPPSWYCTGYLTKC